MTPVSRPHCNRALRPAPGVGPNLHHGLLAAHLTLLLLGASWLAHAALELGTRKGPGSDGRPLLLRCRVEAPASSPRVAQGCATPCTKKSSKAATMGVLVTCSS